MARKFKIHPAIGIARVGKSPEGFFLAGDAPGAPPFEIGEEDDVAFTGYKDANFLVRRQAARFRVYEYEYDEASQTDRLVGEVDPARVKVHWYVKLSNTKAAGREVVENNSVGFDGESVLMPGRNDRNESMARSELAGTVEYVISGVNEQAGRTMARIGGANVNIGEVNTDHSGRLIVLPGPGEAGTFVTGSRLGSFANNDGWYDDVSDGSVDARLEIEGEGMVDDEVTGAWIVTAPPDFAPDVEPIVSLQDIVVDAYARGNQLALPSPLSYVDDIEPILNRAIKIREINDVASLRRLSDLVDQYDGDLGDNTAGALTARTTVFDELIDKLQNRASGGLAVFRFPPFMKNMLTAWRDGRFVRGPVGPPAKTESELLDEAALVRCMGGGFYPGIEAGFLLTASSLYEELGRIKRGNFTDNDGVTIQTVEPGFLTQRMALPWHADFHDCDGDWWPASRPDLTRIDETGTEAVRQWDRGVENRFLRPRGRQRMVDHFAQLGVIKSAAVNGEERQVEAGRDPVL